MYEGRWNRAKYIGTLFGINIAAFVVGLFAGSSGIDPSSVAFLVIFYPINIFIVSLMVVKRLHDLDRPGAHFWLMLIPIYNIYLSLVLLFKKGVAGPNRFGSDPLTKTEVSAG